jgi:hypothetical protein
MLQGAKVAIGLDLKISQQKCALWQEGLLRTSDASSLGGCRGLNTRLVSGKWPEAAFCNFFIWYKRLLIAQKHIITSREGLLSINPWYNKQLQLNHYA